MPLLHAELSRSVLGAFHEVYDHVGYGMLEHLCSTALEDELRARGHIIGRGVTVGVHYEGRQIGTQRLDMVVDDTLVIEVKAVEVLHPSAFRQLLNYLRVTRYEVGLLLNFGPKPTFKRVLYTNDRKPHGTGSRSAVRQ